jgi:hypothetical protein
MMEVNQITVTVGRLLMEIRDERHWHELRTSYDWAFDEMLKREQLTKGQVVFVDANGALRNFDDQLHSVARTTEFAGIDDKAEFPVKVYMRNIGRGLYSEGNSPDGMASNREYLMSTCMQCRSVLVVGKNEDISFDSWLPASFAVHLFQIIDREQEEDSETGVTRFVQFKHEKGYIYACK